MNRDELIKLQEQLEEEYIKIKEEFGAFCDSVQCTSMELFGKSKEEKSDFFDMYLDGEEYDELEAEIQNVFWFSDGTARRKFDVLRNKGGLLCRLYKTVNEVTKAEVIDDEWFEPLADYEIKALIEKSEAVIAEEQSFIETAKNAINILGSLQEE